MSRLYLALGSKVAPDHKLAGLATGGETGEVDMANGGDLPDALSPGAGLSSLGDLEINKPASNESCESTVMDGTCNPSKEGESKEATAGHDGLNTSTAGSG